MEEIALELKRLIKTMAEILHLIQKEMNGIITVIPGPIPMGAG